MTAAARPLSIESLKRRALSFGAAHAFEHAMQFLLPVVLVRFLDAATFGEYRLLWLAIGTLTGLVTLNMPQGLFFFLPRSEAPLKRLYVQQTCLYLAGAGLLCAFLVSPGNRWLPETLEPLAKHGWLVPAFVGLWVASCLLEFLPVIDERVGWGVRVITGLAALRLALLTAGAFLAPTLEALLWILVAFVLLRLCLLAWYIGRRGWFGRPFFDRKLFAGQFRTSAPFGLSSALYGLRIQGDQWIAATLFALQSFAAFSLAAVLNQVLVVFRRSVVEAFLPSMSRIQSQGDVAGMLALNSRGNTMVAALMYPLLGFCFAFADELVTIFYTAAYLEAAPVMRIYVAGLAAMVIEIGSVVLLLQQGRFALGLGFLALALSLTASLAGAHHFGLAGAAAGSVAAIYFDRWFMLRRVSRHTGIPLARLQDWKSLLVAGALAAAASAAAWFAARTAAPHDAYLRLLAGAAVVAVAYGPWLFFKVRKA
jgi:O-antigen/teichoic acid export membrane protein